MMYIYIIIYLQDFVYLLYYYVLKIQYIQIIIQLSRISSNNKQFNNKDIIRLLILFIITLFISIQFNFIIIKSFIIVIFIIIIITLFIQVDYILVTLKYFKEFVNRVINYIREVNKHCQDSYNYYAFMVVNSQEVNYNLGEGEGERNLMVGVKEGKNYNQGQQVVSQNYYCSYYFREVSSINFIITFIFIHLLIGLQFIHPSFLQGSHNFLLILLVLTLFLDIFSNYQCKLL